MPTTTHHRTRGMVAVSKDSKVKPLGYIVWFSVPDEGVTLKKLRHDWGMAGLELKVLPRDQRAVNVFRRAVRDQEGVRTNEKDGTVTETDVREVVETSEDVVYQVSRVVRDVENRVVEYPKALRVWFSKVTDEIDFKPLGDVPPRDVKPIMDAILDAYEANVKRVTGAKVRTLVRHYIKDDSDEQSNMVGLSGENLRGKAGGVYFVPAKFKDELESLAEFLDTLYPGGRAYLYTVPLADGASERELIRRHLVANADAEMEAAIADAGKLIRENRERSVREDVLKHHWRRLGRADRRAAQYGEVLQDNLEDLAAKRELLHKQLRKLSTL